MFEIPYCQSNIRQSVNIVSDGSIPILWPNFSHVNEHKLEISLLFHTTGAGTIVITNKICYHLNEE
jgi:hypothetical protein